MKIFDRSQLRINKSKAFDSYKESIFLYELALENIESRLFIKQHYDKALFIGMRNIDASHPITEHHAIKHKIFADSSPEYLAECKGEKILIDEEYLPFAQESFDLVISLLNIHTINDVPGFLLQIKSILKPGGVFIGTLFGSKTLLELKHACVDAELRIGIASSMHVFPMTDIKEIANLAASCGFAEPISDSEVLVVHYKTLAKLFTDIKNIGERNILYSRIKSAMSRNFFIKIEEAYKDKFGILYNDQKCFPATFEIIYLTAFV
jgi:NADH dehydrogenase [ubiquinone] 1 alpha subcomplex assembly factor 5